MALLDLDPQVRRDLGGASVTQTAPTASTRNNARSLIAAAAREIAERDGNSALATPRAVAPARAIPENTTPMIMSPAAPSPRAPVPPAPEPAQPVSEPVSYEESTAADYYNALGQISLARENAKRTIVIWGLIAAAVALISLASYSSAGAGDTYIVWWGPVAFGIWRMMRAASVLFRLRNF